VQPRTLVHREHIVPASRGQMSRSVEAVLSVELARHTRRMSPSTQDELSPQVTADASMLHTRECPHLGASALASLVPATSHQLKTLPMGSSCRDLLDGGRRQNYPSLEAAMEALPLPLENRHRVRQFAAKLSYAQIWVPASRSYIAVSAGPGSPCLAYFNKGFVDVHRPSQSQERWRDPRVGTLLRPPPRIALSNPLGRQRLRGLGRSKLTSVG